MCIMFMLGQKDINWATAFESILTHEEFPVIMKNCKTFNISPYAFKVVSLIQHKYFNFCLSAIKNLKTSTMLILQ
eukprot:UN11433